MAESDEEVDISNVLLNGGNDKDYEDSFVLDDRPLKKRKTKATKVDQIPETQDDFDLLSTENLSKSRISGSSFKSMGSFS